MTQKTDYSGFDLVVGEVYGLRYWQIDKYGRLKARNWHKASPWRPGVNTAVCLAEQQQRPKSASITQIIDPSGKGRQAIEVTDHGRYRDLDEWVRWSTSGNALASIPSRPGGEPAKRYSILWSDGTTGQYNLDELKFDLPGPHQAPDENCACGFYAYTDLNHEEIAQYTRQVSYVLGIIKGTGRTLIGTRGFRSEKAEIVALRDPARGGRKTDSVARIFSERLSRVYPDVPLLADKAALLEFAPVEQKFDPTSEEFWSLP